jgi:hypothetical protein
MTALGIPGRARRRTGPRRRCAPRPSTGVDRSLRHRSDAVGHGLPAGVRSGRQVKPAAWVRVALDGSNDGFVATRSGQRMSPKDRKRLIAICVSSPSISTSSRQLAKIRSGWPCRRSRRGSPIDRCCRKLSVGPEVRMSEFSQPSVARRACPKFNEALDARARDAVAVPGGPRTPSGISPAVDPWMDP